MSTSNRCIFLTLFACVILAGAARTVEPKRTSDDKNILARFEVAKGGDDLLLPVIYKGKTYQFLLDSGASVNGFDSSLSLGKPIGEQQVGGTAGAVRLKFYTAPEATVGGLTLRTPDPVVAFDFTKFRQASGYEIYGIIGMPFLGRNVVRVDFDKGDLLVLREPGRDCGQEFSPTMVEGLPRLTIDVGGGNKQKAILDTGNNGSNLEKELFGAALKKGHLTALGTILSESVSGEYRGREGRLKQISFGDFTLRDTLFNESTVNLLGLSFCSRFVVTFDYPNQKVYLKKGKHFDRADTRNLSGLHLSLKDGKVVVDSLDKSSAAEAAGIKARDVLVTVDDMKVDGVSMFRVRQQFVVPEKKLRVKIRRADKETTVALVLGREPVVEK